MLAMGMWGVWKGKFSGRTKGVASMGGFSSDCL